MEIIEAPDGRPYRRLALSPYQADSELVPARDVRRQAYQKKSLENHKTMVFQETFLAILYRVSLHSSSLAYSQLFFIRSHAILKIFRAKTDHFYLFDEKAIILVFWSDKIFIQTRRGEVP